jgi:hypothetical protein
MYGIDITPSKEFILSKVSEEQIMSYYLGVEVTFGSRIKSPLRNDRTPTCAFFFSGGKLKFRDYAGHIHGDCFDIVCKVRNCNFRDALEHIIKDMDLISKNQACIPDKEEVIKSQSRTVIKVRKRTYWTETDKDFWLSYGIHSKTLKKFNVFPLHIAWVNDSKVYTHKDQDPCYAYYVKTDDTGLERIKLYLPLRTKESTHKLRFMGNCGVNDIFGYSQLPAKGKLLIITKSLKDVMVLDELGFNSVGVQSETSMFGKELFNELSSRFDTIVTLFDFDYTGVLLSNKFRQTYHTQPYFLTNGRFGSKDYQAKDISDYNKLHNSSHTKQLLHAISSY